MIQKSVCRSEAWRLGKGSSAPVFTWHCLQTCLDRDLQKAAWPSELSSLLKSYRYLLAARMPWTRGSCTSTTSNPGRFFPLSQYRATSQAQCVASTEVLDMRSGSVLSGDKSGKHCPADSSQSLFQTESPPRGPQCLPLPIPHLIPSQAISQQGEALL